MKSPGNLRLISMSSQVWFREAWNVTRTNGRRPPLTLNNGGKCWWIMVETSGQSSVPPLHNLRRNILFCFKSVFFSTEAEHQRQRRHLTSLEILTKLVRGWESWTPANHVQLYMKSEPRRTQTSHWTTEPYQHFDCSRFWFVNGMFLCMNHAW